MRHLSTLCILAGMFTGAGLANATIDPDGRFFIDRDPKVRAPELALLTMQDVFGLLSQIWAAPRERLH